MLTHTPSSPGTHQVVESEPKTQAALKDMVDDQENEKIRARMSNDGEWLPPRSTSCGAKTSAMST